MNTKSRPAQTKFATSTWRPPRRATTFLLQMAQADAERGERIKWLRERLHLTQEAMADKVGVTLRGYQEWEAGGGIRWPNAQKLAKAGNVQADWIMSGDRSETPDLSSQSQLDRIEENQRRIFEELSDLRLALLEITRPSRRQPSRTQRESQTGKAAAGRKNRQGS
jgi:transcriptional regulator with XRE-family HTH domain